MKYNHLDNLIVRHLAGSQAYGTSTPTSDTDYRGIFVADKEFILTPFYTVREVSDPSEEDTKYYELNNYMELYLDANPNILESLWVDESDILFSNSLYEHLRNARYELLSSKIAFTYTGYAHNQAKRMQNHHGWMEKERAGIRILQEFVDAFPCEQVIEWIGDTFPDYVLTALDIEKAKNQYIKTPMDRHFEKQLRNASLQMLSTQPLKQYHFIKLVHNYFDHQVLDRDFTILDYASGYQLVPYGDNIFGLVQKEGAKTLNQDGSIHRIDTSNLSLEEVKEQPKLIVKFNKDEYDKSSDNRHNYHTWKQNRNAVRSELEQLHGYDCYQDDTEFLTNNGWKLYDDITEHDLLATFNKNHEVEYQNYTERFENIFTGNMYHFTGYHQDTLVTSNHKMYVKDYSRNYKKDMSDWKFVEACQLKETYKILNVITPKIRNFKDDTESPIEGVDLNTYLKLMGWYISEGSINFDENGLPKSMYISQCKPNNSFYQSIHKLIKNQKLYYTKQIIDKKEYQNYEENRYCFTKKYAIALVNDCSSGSYNVRIPNWVYDLSKRKMDILLKSLLEGDGSKRKLVNENETYIYHTANSNLADDVQKLAFLCGYETSKWGPYTNDNSYKDNHTMYQVHINKKPETERINTNNNLEIIPVVNNRTVCFSVPNSTLVTRRNGKISLHSNCKHAMHVVRLLRTAEEALITGEVHVKRPDAAELLAIRNGAWTYDEMMEYWKDRDQYIREVLYKQTELPRVPDINKAAKLLVELREIQWYGK